MSLDVYIPEDTSANAPYATPATQVDPWDAIYAMGTEGYDPGAGGGMFLPGMNPSIETARNLARGLGIDPAQAAALYAQGQTSMFGSPTFAGATDLGNINLRGGWGIENMLRATGNWNDNVAYDLAQWVDRGYQDMNMRRAADKQKARAALGQFIGMLGGTAFAPFAFGGSELLGSVGGRIASGAANVVGSVVGGGNPLGAIAGAVGGPLSDLAGSSLQSVFAGLGPTGAKIADNLVRSMGVSALQQTANTGRIDPNAMLMAAAPGAVDTAFDAAGGWSGMFGGGGAAQGWTSGYDLPMGQIAPYAEQMRVFGSDSPEAFDTSGLFSQHSYVNQPEFMSAPNMKTALAQSMNPAELADIDAEIGILTGDLPLEAYTDPGFASFARTLQMNAPPRQETPQPTQQFDPAAIGSEQGPTAPEEQPADKPWYDNIKPGALVALGIKIAGLLGADDAMADQGRAIAEAEYATEEQRRQAYLDYANRVFGAIPEIADAYDPKFFAENSAMGRVEIDPATGEARYILTPEAQASVDKMIDAADKVMSQILETDVTKLSETEFQKKLETLRGKRDADLAKLLRVLYARGMLGVATYEGAGTDLITGRTESFALQPGQEANPFLGAYMAGVERENAALSGQSMNDAQNFIDKLLGESTGLADEITGAQNSMLDAILGAGSRYAARNAGEQARGNALSQLLESPAGLFADRLGPQDLAMALARQNEEEELRKRSAGMMGGM